MGNPVRLLPSDPVIFAKCPSCTVRSPGDRMSRYFAKAYSEREWLRKPLCENCESEMAYMYEVVRDVV